MNIISFSNTLYTNLVIISRNVNILTNYRESYYSYLSISDDLITTNYIYILYII